MSWGMQAWSSKLFTVTNTGAQPSCSFPCRALFFTSPAQGEDDHDSLTKDPLVAQKKIAKWSSSESAVRKTTLFLWPEVCFSDHPVIHSSRALLTHNFLLSMSGAVNADISCSPQLLSAVQQHSDTPPLSSCCRPYLNMTLSALSLFMLPLHLHITAPSLQMESPQAPRPPMSGFHGGDVSWCRPGQDAPRSKSLPVESKRQRLPDRP